MPETTDVLADGAIDLWQTDVDAASDRDRLASYERLLSREEAGRHRRFLRERDRNLFLVAHALVRTTLSRYYPVSPSAWEFEVGERGRPEVSSPADTGLLTFDGLAGNGAAIDIFNGLFNAQLDFGTEAFNDDPRWLEVAVSCPTGVGVYTTLSPREKISAVPRAIRTRGIAVDDNGRVGIGTEEPNELLHVAGNISLQAEGFDPYIVLVAGDGLEQHPVLVHRLQPPTLSREGAEWESEPIPFG